MVIGYWLMKFKTGSTEDSETRIKTTPGSLIAQGLSGLNGAKI